MEKIISLLKKDLSYKQFPYLSILANVFLGYALGKILITPGDEMPDHLLIKVFLILGTCFFANYLLCVKKAAGGIIRTAKGKLRPALKEAFLCAALNAFIFVAAISLFLIKSFSL
ncbi:MAG TPA: hypothetical protein VLS90_09335 [Thermodesulfobacteriota bacterium]|nr:hypothetical protein [Thermodesulfobacteriota bacterium]